MAKADEIRSAKREDRKPFSSPVDDEVIEILIPEGAESGKIPAGDQYIGRLLGVIREESKTSGNPMLTWQFTMHEGEYIGMDFTLWTPLTANSSWKLSDTVTALGVKWEPGQKVQLNPKDLKGTLVRMVIKDDNYEGRERSKLDKILPHPDGAGTKGKGGFTVPRKAEEEEEEDRPVRGATSARVRPRVEEPEEEEDFPRARGRGRSRSAEDDMEETWGGKPGSRKNGREVEEEEEERPVRRSRAAREEEEPEEDEPPVRRGRPPVRGRGR